MAKKIEKVKSRKTYKVNANNNLTFREDSLSLLRSYHARKYSLSRFAGVLTDEEAQELKREIIENRDQQRLLLIRQLKEETKRQNENR